jgi:hypothetical protein
MRAFVFVNNDLKVVTTEQAGTNLPNPAGGKWTFNRQINDVAKELTAHQVNTLNSEGWLVIK